MKMFKSYFAIALAALAMSVTSCMQPVEGNVTSDSDKAPSPITPDMINWSACVAEPGGYNIIFNSLPEESNMLYVKAEYTVDNGDKIRKSMSVYSDTLKLEGFGTKPVYEVDLYAVSRRGTESEKLTIEVEPLEPSVNVVGRSIAIKGSFSSMLLSCENPQRKNLDIYVELTYFDENTGKEINVSKVNTITSHDSVKTIIIDDLPGGWYEIASYVGDRYGNVSEKVQHEGTEVIKDVRITGKVNERKPELGDYDPYIEEPRKWSFIEDTRLYGRYMTMDNEKGEYVVDESKKELYVKGGLRNAQKSFGAGKIEYFFDGQTEENYKADDNQTSSHFVTGITKYAGTNGYWAYPYSYFIDLGRTVELSRVTVHQAYGVKYAMYSTKTFELWGREEMAGDDAQGADLLSGWFQLGTYTIEKPLTESDQNAMFIKGHTFQVKESVSGDPELADPIRYLWFKGIEDFNPGKPAQITVDGQKVDVPGAPYQGQLAEITLYGVDSYEE